MAYLFPNSKDNLKTQLTCAVPGEFIRHLDSFLQDEHDESHDGSVTLDTLETVRQVCDAALGLIGQLDWRTSQCPSLHTPKSANEVAHAITEDVVQALNELKQQNTADECEKPAGKRKRELTCTLSGEFFLELGCLAEAVEARSCGVAAAGDVSMLLGCIDAAMGMVYELERVTWADGHPVPARAILPIRNHVISDSLYWSGEEAVRLVEHVYQAVVNLVMKED